MHPCNPTRQTVDNFATPFRAADAAKGGADSIQEDGVASASLITHTNLSAIPLRLNEENALHNELGQFYLCFKEEQKEDSSRDKNRMNSILERVDQLVSSLRAVKELSHAALEYEWHILNGLTEHSSAVEKQNILARVQKVAGELQRRHPGIKMDLKNLTTAVVIHNQFVPVLKISLLARSEVFEAQFRFGEDRILDLDIEEVKCATREAFLTFLQSGRIDLSKADPIELLMLADKYDAKDLLKAVLEEINENISDDNVLDLLQLALFLSNKDLVAHCMLHLFNCKRTLRSEDPELSTILHSLSKLKAIKGSLTYNPICKIVDIRFKNCSTDYSEILNTLCKYGELRLLLLNDIHDELSLRKLLQSSPHLHHLTIRYATPATISGLDNLKTLDCKHCPNLRSFSAPRVTTLNCANCPQLSSFTAPMATHVDCSFCPELRSFTAPMANCLYCRGCPLLTDELIKVAKDCEIIR